MMGLLALWALACGGDDGDDGDGGGGGEAQAEAGAMTADASAAAPAAAEDAAGSDRQAGAPPEVITHARDWPMANRDYASTRATFDTAIDSENVGELAECWRFALPGASVFGFVTSNPLILGDLVLIQDMASNVFALDRRDGSMRWQALYQLSTVGPNGVAVGWGKVFASRGDMGLVALDLESGEELWRFDPPLRSSEGLDIQPLVFDDMVLISTVPASLRGAYLGGSRGVIYALDQQSGREIWRFDTVDSEDIWGNASVNSGGGAWYPPSIDPERGLSYWGTGNPGPFPGTPEHPSGSSRPGDNFFTSGLLALGLRDGALAFFHQERAHDLFDWDFQNPPILVKQGLEGPREDLVVGSGKTGTVVALAADGGALRWRAEVGVHENDALETLSTEPITVSPGVFGGVLTPPAYAEGVVYVPVVDLPSDFTESSVVFDFAEGRGALTALAIEDGREIFSFALPAPALGGALVVGDLVFTSDANGGVYGLRRADGQMLFHRDMGAGINAPLAAAGSMLLVPAGYATLEPALVALCLP